MTDLRWWWPVAAWTAVAGLMALVLWAQAHVPMPWALVSAVGEYSTLGLLSVLVWKWSARVTASGWSTERRAFAHVLIAIVVLVTWRGVVLLMQFASLGDNVWRFVYQGTWMFQAVGAVWTYAAMLGVILVLQTQRRQQHAERQSAALALTAREAELGALRAHLQPHFLCNSLTAVASLMDEDPARARIVLHRLADLLQSTYARLEHERVTLERELELTRAYLSIEQIRFGERLKVVVESDDGARHASVPPLILQPLVENAVKYGIAPFPRGGEVRVAARLVDERLHVEVFDTGVGMDDDTWPGQGLTLTRRRLAAAYPANHSLRFVRQATGFSVELDLPTRLDVA